MSHPAHHRTLDTQICFPLYACTKEVIRQYSKRLDPYNLTYTQYIVMLVLWEHHEIPFADLAKRVYLDSGTLTPLLKKLEAKGFITRHRSDADERCVVITITEEGAALQEKVYGIPDDIRSNIDVPDEDLRLLKEMVDRLTAQIVVKP